MADSKPVLTAVQSGWPPKGVALERHGGLPYDHHWYVGTREELIAAGVVDDRPFPGEVGATGKRGERFVDASGRRCRVCKESTPRHKSPTFRLSIYMLPSEREQARADHDEERKSAEALKADEDEAERKIMLTPKIFQRTFLNAVDSLLNMVGNGNATYASMAGENTPTLRIDSVEAEAILVMLRQVKARLKAARIVPCIVGVATEARPSHLRVAWSAPAAHGSA